jgi:predicted phosphodiesterase
MKIENYIQFVSDVHLEYRSEAKWWKTEIIPSAPYLILAGDIAPANYHILPSFYKWCSKKFKKTIHVPGNHEYWDPNRKLRSIHSTDVYLERLCNNYGIIYAQKKVIILDPEIPPLICCTLWCSPKDEAISRNDYKRILDFSPQCERKINSNHIDFIQENIDRYQKLGQKCIVVTHHAPLTQGTVKKEYENTDNSSSYVNDLSDLVDQSLCWVFGHTHFVCDIVRDSGAIVCSNPIGSKQEKLPYDRSATIQLN